MTSPNMGSAQSGRSDTLRRLNVAELDATKGTATTDSIAREGQPVGGQVVTLNLGPETYTKTGTGGTG